MPLFLQGFLLVILEKMALIEPIVSDDGSVTTKVFMTIIMALAQIPISTFSHIWVFVRQYGIMFVIIVIIIIIIIIYRKVKVSTL